MNEELFDIVDKNNNFLNVQKTKRETHNNGLWHRASHIWIYNSKGEILLQLRAKEKFHYPNLWDISASGHISAGEDPITSGLREVWEEIGLKIKKDDLNFWMIRKSIHNPGKFKEREFEYVYFFKFNGNINKLKLQKEEVQEIKFVSIDKIKEELKINPEKYVPRGSYWFEVLDKVKLLIEEELKQQIENNKACNGFKEDGAIDFLKNRNMKNVIVIHGCPSNPEKISPETRTYDKHWIPWLTKELKLRGVKVEAPLMPNPWQPVYEDFKKEFEKIDVNENSILIGHSCGCAFLVRWLGEVKQKINKLILVAPWKINDKGDDFREKFYDYLIDETIKNRVNKVIMFTSETEKKEGKQSLSIFHKVLDGQIINLPSHGHYTSSTMGKDELPELLENVLN